MARKIVTFAFGSCLAFTWIACGPGVETFDAGNDDTGARVDSGSNDTTASDNRVADTRIDDASQPDMHTAVDAAVADTQRPDSAIADIHGNDLRVDATTSDTQTNPDTTPVDAFVELSCSGALTCTLRNCGDGNRTCAEACAESVCETNVALWDALFTCIDTNCSEACATSLSSAECIACRQQFCQTEFTACGSSTCE